MKDIARANQKGGVAKTTTTHNLGVALAAKGKRVLLIDLDSQASLTISVNGEYERRPYYGVGGTVVGGQ